MRNLLRLEVLQWVGLFGAGVVWAGSHLLSFALSEARCGPGTVDWGLAYTPIAATLYGIAFALAAGAETAAVIVFKRTREVEHDGPPPDGRQQFFAAGAALGNLLFLEAIVLNAVGTLSHAPCHQS
jgi:hypothetical protein